MPDRHSISLPASGRRAAISPLSAATLLLLVSMVVAASPTLRGGSEFADHRQTGPRVVYVDEAKGAEQQRHRRAEHRADHLDRVPDEPGAWVSLVADGVDHSAAAEAAPTPALLRAGLLDLPPPALA